MVFNLLGNKSFVVTIGNFGAVVALYGKDNIISKVFLKDFNDVEKEELKKLFNFNKSAPIYILLDTLDQSYKKKIYPAVTRSDLSRLMIRDMHSDPDKESLKNNIILNPKKLKSHSWECLYVSSSRSEVINTWIDFLLEMPNYAAGIYMLPVETFHLNKALKKILKKTDKKHDVCCLIFQTQASGIRQVIFSDQGIAFTRVVNYDLEQKDFLQKDFLQKYEADIYSSFEYLKRVFPDIAITDFDIINIFPNDILDVIKNSTNLELKHTNITPHQSAVEVGLPSLVEDGEKFCDILISRIFVKEKKILKFSIPKMEFLGRLFLTLKFANYTNLLLSGLIVLSFLYMAFSQSSIRELIRVSNIEKTTAMVELDRVRSAAFDGEKIIENGKAIDLETVMDFGKLETVLGSKSDNFIQYYLKLSFLKNHNVQLGNFTYSVLDFKDKGPEVAMKYKIQFTGKILNKGGDIEDLFTNFDLLVAAVKKAFGENSQIKYSELPRNIDFNQKYYDFNIDFTVISGS